MTKTKRINPFKGIVAEHSKREKQAAVLGYGYLNLPEGIKSFNPEPGGRAKLDFIPYVVSVRDHPDKVEDLGIAVKDSIWYRFPFKIHRNIGAKNETVVCPTSFGKPCPICEYRNTLFQKSAPKEETDAFRASKRNLYAVIPIGNRDYEEKIHIWDVSHHLFQTLLNDELEDNEEFETFAGLEDGYTLRIRFDAKTINKSKPFAQASRIDFIERKEVYEESILDEVPALESLPNVLSYKELQNLMYDEADDLADKDSFETVEEVTDDDDVEQQKPVRHIPKKSREEEPREVPYRKRKKIDKDDDDESARQEEVQKPAKSKQPSGKQTTKEDHKCPYGHIFGTDCEEYKEDCDECKLWGDCLDEQEGRA